MFDDQWSWENIGAKGLGSVGSMTLLASSRANCSAPSGWIKLAWDGVGSQTLWGFDNGVTEEADFAKRKIVTHELLNNCLPCVPNIYL